jgi:hypothetical protein
MAVVNYACHISDDVDMLTIMNDAIVIDAYSSKDARDVSRVL